MVQPPAPASPANTPTPALPTSISRSVSRLDIKSTTSAPATRKHHSGNKSTRDQPRGKKEKSPARTCARAEPHVRPTSVTPSSQDARTPLHPQHQTIRYSGSHHNRKVRPFNSGTRDYTGMLQLSRGHSRTTTSPSTSQSSRRYDGSNEGR